MLSKKFSTFKILWPEFNNSAMFIILEVIANFTDIFVVLTRFPVQDKNNYVI